MNFKDFYKVIEKNSYYVFSKNDIESFYPDENAKNTTKLIYRWKKKGWIYTLKKGLYEMTYPKDFSIPDLYIANKIYSPSYISLETALSNYSIIPEVSMAVTSITTKSTRTFRNKHGLFLYRTVKPQSFTGYYIEKQGNFEIYIAEPEKAIVDYLYFKMLRGKKVDFEAERINFSIVAGLRKSRIEKYAKLYGISLKELYVNI
ncbi:MAG: hypothetical protein PHE88_08290 [Elusimicrobia bacterium]|nr:hypothetical protein [Elusimicrobiota bacterium]